MKLAASVVGGRVRFKSRALAVLAAVAAVAAVAGALSQRGRPRPAGRPFGRLVNDSASSGARYYILAALQLEPEERPVRASDLFFEIRIPAAEIIFRAAVLPEVRLFLNWLTGAAVFSGG